MNVLCEYTIPFVVAVLAPLFSDRCWVVDPDEEDDGGANELMYDDGVCWLRSADLRFIVVDICFIFLKIL